MRSVRLNRKIFFVREVNVYDNDTDDGCLWRFIVMDLLIRFAKMEDAEELLALYTPYVTDTVITFEYEVPSLEEFKDRMRQTMKKYPYLVAEQNGEILGYSCAGAFKGRAAYDWAVETTIYIRKDRQKTGVGKKLYEALEKVLYAQNICNLYACIGYLKLKMNI